MSDHCESCGQEDPDTDDGYTTCCNEPVCFGGGLDRWNTGDPRAFHTEHKITGTPVSACCPARAQQMLPAGVAVLTRAD